MYLLIKKNTHSGGKKIKHLKGFVYVQKNNITYNQLILYLRNLQ